MSNIIRGFAILRTIPPVHRNIVVIDGQQNPNAYNNGSQSALNRQYARMNRPKYAPFQQFKPSPFDQNKPSPF